MKRLLLLLAALTIFCSVSYGWSIREHATVAQIAEQHLTPEAKELGESLIAEGAKEYIIDDAELARVQAEYPVVWKNPDAKPKLCFMGCPHMSLEQLTDWTKKIQEALKEEGK